MSLIQITHNDEIQGIVHVITSMSPSYSLMLTRSSWDDYIKRNSENPDIDLFIEYHNNRFGVQIERIVLDQIIT